jgi:hypothetical protein
METVCPVKNATSTGISHPLPLLISKVYETGSKSAISTNGLRPARESLTELQN